MAVIKIVDFGGLVPRMTARSLPPGAAQQNDNLLATDSSFRPLLDDSVVKAIPAAAKTLHRMVRNAQGGLHTDAQMGWVTDAADTNLVRGQISDDASERTYVSVNDGSAPPRAIDATGANRILGVPPPASLKATANITDEFSVDDALDADVTQVQAISEAIKKTFTTTQYMGNSIPPAAPTRFQIGWIAHGDAVTSGKLPSSSIEQWNLCLPVWNGEMNEAFEFLRGTGYAGAEVQVGGETYWAVAVTLNAPVKTPNGTQLTAALTAMKRPDDKLEPLFSQEEVASIVASSLDYWSTTKEPLLGAIKAAEMATDMVRQVIDGLGNPASYSTKAYNDAYAAFMGPSYAAAGPGADRIFYTAAQLAKTPSQNGNGAFGNVMLPSRYWIYGNGPACYTNLKEDVATCISVDATGARSFDFSKLQDLLNKDFMLLINQDDTDAEAHKQSLQSTIEWCVQPYRDFFSFNALVALGSVKKTSAERAIAFSGVTGEAVQALNAIKALSDEMQSQTLAAGKNAWALGARARVVGAAVARIIEDRFYVATHVTDWGEESAPGEPTDKVEIDQNDSVTLLLAAPPAGRNVSHWRLYRSNSGSTAAAFQFVDEIPVSTSTYTDTKKASELGESCPTIGPDGMTYWLEPPTRLGNNGTPSTKPNPHLRGLTGMPNGVMAGFIDNFVAFCEPYMPYAWPLQYQISIKHPIVGLGSFGQSLFVGTMANPSIISGSDSASMSEQVLDDAQACMSAKSIVSAGNGVLYASPDGICFASLGGVQVITAALFSREDWSALSPASIRATMHEGVYYFWYSGGDGGCYALDMVARKLTRVDMKADAVFYDSLTDAVFYTSGLQLKRAFSAGRRVGVWKTGKVELAAQEPMAWGRVMGDQSAASPVTITWAGDGEVRYVKTVTDTHPWRMPPGRYLEHEVTVSGAARVSQVFLAGSTEELRGA